MDHDENIKRLNKHTLVRFIKWAVKIHKNMSRDQRNLALEGSEWQDIWNDIGGYRGLAQRFPNVLRTDDEKVVVLDASTLCVEMDVSEYLLLYVEEQSEASLPAVSNYGSDIRNLVGESDRRNGAELERVESPSYAPSSPGGGSEVGDGVYSGEIVPRAMSAMQLHRDVQLDRHLDRPTRSVLGPMQTLPHPAVDKSHMHEATLKPSSRPLSVASNAKSTRSSRSTHSTLSIMDRIRIKVRDDPVFSSRRAESVALEDAIAREEFTMTLKVKEDDLNYILKLIPQPFRAFASETLQRFQVDDIVMDVGRPLEFRIFKQKPIRLSSCNMTREELQVIAQKAGFQRDVVRVCVGPSLHRVTRSMKDGMTNLVTIRVARSAHPMYYDLHYVPADGFERVVSLCTSGKSFLILGPPCTGKTTLLRLIIRYLSDIEGRRVVVVDPSRELAGDGDTPHAAVGSARRIVTSGLEAHGRGARSQRQRLDHHGALDAVVNHSAEVVVVDELMEEHDATEMRSIAARKVQLIATAHGSLASLVENPKLVEVLGGKQTVILADRNSIASGGAVHPLERPGRWRDRKTVEQRRGRPCFDAVLELLPTRGLCRITLDVAAAVDQILMVRQ